MPHDVQKRILLLCSLLVFLLSACSSSPEPVAIEATAPPQVTREPIATEAPAATNTPAPSATATLPPTASVPPTPTLIPLGSALALERGNVPERLYVVMIDNHPNAYPQSGMDKSPLVFEALAEFGLTRYLLVIAPEISPKVNMIGPVRSARAYFVQWAIGLKSAFVHAGGSPDGLALAESAVSIENVDALRRDGGAYFWREETRSAPHNLYTNSDLLAKMISERDAADFDSSTIGYLFKDEAPEAERPSSQDLDYYFLYKEDSVGWNYNPNDNSYHRLRRGRAQIDGTSGKQLVFKNVVVMEVSEALRAGDDKGRIDQEVLGEGIAQIFMDGTMVEARWRKESNADPLLFFDTDGNEIAFNVGPIWISAIPAITNLTVEGGK